MNEESRRPVTVSEAARILECCVDTVRRLAETGILPVARTPAGVRIFDERQVRKLAAERQERRTR
jgi:excisionase family DNA binding protein